MSSDNNRDSNIPGSQRTTSPWQVDPDIQRAVDKYIAANPERHRLAQNFGEFLLTHPNFSQVDQFKVDPRDIAGDEIKINSVLQTMGLYGIKPKELDADELALLEWKFGPNNWKAELTQKFNFAPDDFPPDP